MNTECTVTGYLALTLQVAKYVGLAPIHIEKTGKSRRISISLTYHVIGCVAVTIKGVVLLLAVLFNDHYRLKNPKNPLMQSTAWILEAVTMTITYILLTYTASRQMRCIIDVMNQLQQIRIMLNVPDLTISLHKKKIVAFATVGIVSMIFVLFDYWSLLQMLKFTHKESAIIIIMWKVIYFINSVWYWVIPLDEVIFILLVLHIRCIFQAINNCLKNLLKVIEHQQQESEMVNNATYKILPKINNYVESEQDSMNTFSGDIKKLPHRTVHHLASAYSRACKTVHTVDSFYGLRLVTVLGMKFIFINTTSYNFINNLINVDELQLEDPIMFFASEISLCFWCLFHLLDLGMLIEPCHWTHTEMETTREVVSRLIVHTHSVSDPLAVELERFRRRLVVDNTSFSPLNVFTISRKLMLTMLSSIITYLVIMVDIKV